MSIFKVDWSDLAELISHNIPLREIARSKKCSHSSVRKAIRRMGIDYVFDKSSLMKQIALRDGLSERMKGNTFALNLKYQTKPRIKLLCEYCGKEYEKLLSRTHYKHHFCSKKCRALWVGSNSTQTIEYKEKKRQISLKNGSKPPLMTGENHWNWKGGVSEYSRGADWEYCRWRKDVLRKDNFTCQICGIRGGKLSAHHIREWAEYPELRYDVNNGQCLHYDCHMKLHGLNKKTA